MKEIALRDLRERQEITQEDLAGILEVKQSSISKIESRGLGISVGLLEKNIEALGGELELRAKFSDGSHPFSLAVSENEERAS
jgi:transcriptional regulator with XRE-family HTH domain